MSGDKNRHCSQHSLDAIVIGDQEAADSRHDWAAPVPPCESAALMAYTCVELEQKYATIMTNRMAGEDSGSRDESTTRRMQVRG